MKQFVLVVVDFILNNAFKNGENSTAWNISGILTFFYWLFKDSPARREDFASISSHQKFPVQFCNSRWLENAPAVERAILIWPDIITYITNGDNAIFLSNKSIKSYLTVYNAIKQVDCCKVSLFFVNCECCAAIFTILPK